MWCLGLSLTSEVKTERGGEGRGRKKPLSMNPQNPGWYHLHKEPNLSSAWLLGLAAQRVSAVSARFRARVSQVRSKQPVWWNMDLLEDDSKEILAVGCGYPSSYGCLPTGLHFELQLCCSGKKLNHNHILMWAAKRFPIGNLHSPWQRFL